MLFFFFPIIPFQWINLEISGQHFGPDIKWNGVEECRHHFKYIVGKDQDQQTMENGFSGCDLNGIPGGEISYRDHRNGINHLAC